MTSSSSGTLLSAAMAAFLLAIGPAHAQQDQQNLSEQEVTGFFDRMERNVTEAVEAGAYGRLLEWARTSIADEARFFVSTEIYAEDERKSFTVTSLDKEDVVWLGEIATGMMSAMLGQPVQGYALDLEVIEVDLIGPDAATVSTRIAESVSDLARPSGEGEAGAQNPGAQPMQAGAIADCEHLIRRREAADRLLIGLTTCQVRTRL